MTTKTPIFMNIAYLNGNFDGKLAKNLADGSVGRGGDFCPRPLYVTPSDFCNQNFSKAFLTKENHCLKMKRDDSLKKYPSINPVSVVPSQGYPEFKLPAFSV